MENNYKKATVTTREAAWVEVNKIFPTDYEKDETASANAGYSIYRHPTLNHYSRICDLGNRLEVLTGEYGENVTNIWIEPEIIKGMGTEMSEADYQALCGRTDIKTYEMSEEQAKVYINDEFGFEVSRIKIIPEVKTYKKEGAYAKPYQTYTRTPQYCSTDYNYIRFDAGNWFYECVNGQLYQYYC